MRFLALLFTTALLIGCQSKPATNADQFLAEIQSPVTINWGVYDESSQQLTYQHPGIPGNLAILTGTRDINGNALKAVVLGPPLDVSKKVPARILGVLEQAGADGLIRTIIATVGAEESLIDMETRQSGSLAVLEAGLVKLEPGKSRSLGFQSADYALDLIRRSR